jgi:hypothetical protein
MRPRSKGLFSADVLLRWLALVVVVSLNPVLFCFGLPQEVVIPQQRRDRQIYVIGDLHGDFKCAKHWVQRTGLVDNVDNPQQWLQDDASLIFMGDYIDKGPFSYQTLLFVKSLTDAFPTRVTALMGNHEMEVLKDRSVERDFKYYYQISHVVHPSEYAHHLNRDLDQEDELVVELLLNATLKVYGEGKKGPPVHFTPQRLPDGIASNPKRKCVVDVVESHQELVRERLTEYQQAYIASFMSNTTLGGWMEKTLKVAHIENGIFFTHGGIETKIATQLTTNYTSIDALNAIVADNLADDNFFHFIVATPTGRLVEKMLYHRGNHKEDACPELLRNFQLWGGVHTLAVGHTPLAKIRRKCGDQLLALDSLLGRWIRTSQGFHCRPNEVRKSGNFTCPKLIQQCRGQIVKFLPDGNIIVIEA